MNDFYSAANDFNTTGRYRVTFDKIGRRRDVEPLTTESVNSADALAKKIATYARKFLLSNDIDVNVLVGHDGTIWAGGRAVGTFTWAKI